MRLKRVTWLQSMAIGGPMSGKTSDEKDFESITLNSAHTTVALVPHAKGDGEPVAYLVPWQCAQAATCLAEALKPPKAK